MARVRANAGVKADMGLRGHGVEGAGKWGSKCGRVGVRLIGCGVEGLRGGEVNAG